jgi:hypothetical protein
MSFGPKEFRKAGEILFGPSHWQNDFSKALGLKSTRRIRQWLSGDPLPASLREDVIKLLEDRKMKLEKVLNSIKE